MLKTLHINLKLQAVSFASLSPSMFENLQMHFWGKIIFLALVVLMFWAVCVSVSQSPHRSGYCTLKSQILAHILEYITQIRIFTRYCYLNKYITSLPILFWSTKKKSITINDSTNGNCQTFSQIVNVKNISIACIWCVLAVYYSVIYNCPTILISYKDIILIQKANYSSFELVLYKIQKVLYQVGYL